MTAVQKNQLDMMVKQNSRMTKELHRRVKSPRPTGEGGQMAAVLETSIFVGKTMWCQSIITGFDE
jgi:hypothetical protein